MDSKYNDRNQRAVNKLALWANENSDSPETLQERQSTALRLAIECINNGTLDSLDSVNSPLSQEIKKHHKTEIFEMNSNWAETSQHWHCPCCGRSKFEISRVGSKSQILAKLVIHHDHMTDALKAAFHKVFLDSGTERPTNTGLAMIERMAPAFSAYAPILICEDCNNADAAAKKLLANKTLSVKWQSFSTGQIRQFINISNHSSHTINESNLLEVWARIRPAYVARMNLAYKVAEAAVLQDYWYEGYSPEIVAIPTLSNGHHRYGGLELINTESFSHEMAQHSIVHKPNMSRWRTESKPRGPVPPKNYLAMLLSLPGCARMWEELPNTWKCPICQRSKFESVSFVKGKSTFQTHLPSRSNRAWKGIQKICKDCTSTIMSIKWELVKEHGANIKDSFDCVTPAQLKTIITSRPHSPHLIDRNKSKLLIDQWISQMGF